MNLPWALVVGGGTSYLLGAIPTGYVVARIKGVDIRRLGSGNIGATNVFRCVGWGAGIVTLGCDVLKGFLPTFVLPGLLLTDSASTLSRTTLGLVAAVSSVVGHVWPVYLGFRGGKGVATAAGAALGLDPASVGVGALVWIAVFLVARYVSVASLVAAAATTGAAWGLWVCRASGAPFVPGVFSVLALLTIVRHRANLQRLWKGTEPRVALRGCRSKSATPS